VRFWDSSAIVPLIVEETTSATCRQLLRADAQQLVFCFTRTEVLSALWRRHRAGQLDAAAIESVEARLEELSARWTEVISVHEVRVAAERLLRAHPLRAADALQLGACVAVFGAQRRDREFVVLDDLLAEAARQVGFRVVVPRA